MTKGLQIIFSLPYELLYSKDQDENEEGTDEEWEDEKVMQRNDMLSG